MAAEDGISAALSVQVQGDRALADVTVTVRPAGATAAGEHVLTPHDEGWTACGVGDDAWTQVAHAEGVPVGSVPSTDITQALGVEAPAADISIRVDGTEEAAARLDLADLSITAPDGGDLSCTSDIQDGQQMAPSVTWAPMQWQEPADPALSGGASGTVFASPEAAGYPAGTVGLSTWFSATFMPDAVWYSVTGEDEEGTVRTRVAVLQPVPDESEVPADGRPTESAYWGQFDGYAAPEDAAPAPAPAEDPSEDPAPTEGAPTTSPEGHVVPEKAQTGDAPVGWLAAAGAVAAGALVVARRRFGLR